MTTKTASKATATATAAKAKAKTAAKNGQTLEALVKGFKTLQSQETEALDFINAKRESLGGIRVQMGRAAVGIFRHPDIKEKYATAAKAVGMPRNTFRRYVDAGLALKSATSAKVTPADIKTANGLWDSEAAKAKSDRDAKAAADKLAKPAPKAAKGAKAPSDKVECKHVHAALDEAVRVTKLYTKGNGLTKAQHAALVGKVDAIRAMLDGVVADGDKSNA